MKLPYNISSTLFCEQVSTVTLLFEKWNDCERAVVMYALLKRVSFQTLKFLQISIEANLMQNFGSQKNLSSIEMNANCSKFLDKLIDLYKSFPTAKLAQIEDKDSMLYGSDLYLNDTNKNYHSREDILSDILSMIPLLRPGNEKAKEKYISLMPIAVEDTVHQIVSPEYVQQIFSYLLIHPAISNADRRSLSHWLRHLEDHIQSSLVPGQRSFYIVANPSEAHLENICGSLSSSNLLTQKTWQAVAPPSHKQQTQHRSHQSIHQQANCTLSCHNSASSTSSSDWNLNVIKLPSASDLNNLSSSQNSLGLLTIDQNEAENAEDSHISFSKNGTEVLEFDIDTGEAEQQTMNLSNIGEQLAGITIKNIADPMLGIKTRRSNSLTAPLTTPFLKQEDILTNDVSSNSTENLTYFTPKQRSFSLSIDSSHNSLPSSISETRLDDLKCTYLKGKSQNSGMTNIGQWLKSLRLHKYCGIFANMSYEDMLKISEEYLQKIGVTKGASHKLALCIDKLKERFVNLSKIQVNLIENKVPLNSVIESLTTIVLTPMKPSDCIENDNVASKFLEVLDLVCQIVIKKDASTLIEEECINGILWTLEKTLHSQAFVSHVNLLKEYKFKLSKLKMQLEPRVQNVKSSGVNSLPNKARWTNTKIRKTDGILKSRSADRIHRKNSKDGPESALGLVQLHNTRTSLTSGNLHKIPQKTNIFQRNQTLHDKNCNMGTATCLVQHSQYKSASYPNFSAPAVNVGKTMQISPQISKSQQYHHHHRHSLNNLIVLSTSNRNQKDSKLLDVKQLDCSSTFKELREANPLHISQVDLPIEHVNHYPLPSVKKYVSSAPLNKTSNKLVKSNIGEINSSLEFLCLQMTEHAIN